MGDGDETISAEEFERWVTAPEAVARRRTLNLEDKVRQIFERLKLGHLRAAAHHATQDDRSLDYFLIPKASWVNTDIVTPGSDLWSLGDTAIYLPKPAGAHGYHDAKKIVLLGVRFDPAQLAEFAPASIASPKTSAETVIEEAPNAPEKDQNLPRVSDAHLAAWYELYRKTYQGSEDTTARAESSARGCFPGKSVSRQRIRDLFEDRKRGRKTRPIDE